MLKLKLKRYCAITHEDAVISSHIIRSCQTNCPAHVTCALAHQAVLVHAARGRDTDWASRLYESLVIEREFGSAAAELRD